MKYLHGMSSQFSTFDHEMMDIALRMAKRGLGTSAPNPAVGAVIVNEKSKELLARGWTQRGGRPHAETEALRIAGEKAHGATLYVTLEPCAHFGVTPPCVDAIIAAHIKRVFVGLQDPDPRTSGNGLQQLKAANVEVFIGLRENQARWITMGHILRQTEGRPLVSLKIATDKKGIVPYGKGTTPHFVTGSQARAFGHLLRSQADAILIGSGTLYGDNPELTCRLPGLHSRSPLRIILLGNRKIPLESKIVRSAKKVPVLLISDGSHTNAIEEFRNFGVEIMKTDPDHHGVSIPGVLNCLASRGITRVLIEGGPKVWRSFSLALAVDEIFHFHASENLPAAQSKDILETYLPNFNYDLSEESQLGSDTLCHWRRPLPIQREHTEKLN